jgi:hypothetical protein
MDALKTARPMPYIFYPRKEGPFKIPLKKHAKKTFSYFIPSPSL